LGPRWSRHQPLLAMSFSACHRVRLSSRKLWGASTATAATKTTATAQGGYSECQSNVSLGALSKEIGTLQSLIPQTVRCQGGFGEVSLPTRSNGLRPTSMTNSCLLISRLHKCSSEHVLRCQTLIHSTARTYAARISRVCCVHRLSLPA